MVAHSEARSSHPSASREENPHDEGDLYGEESFHRRGNRGGLRRLLASSARLLDLQIRIWLTEAKIAVAKIVMYVLLFSAAAVLGILGIIFLFIGAFHILTDVFGLPRVWAYLIFAGVQFGLAIALILAAKGMLNQPAGPSGAAAIDGEK